MQRLYFVCPRTGREIDVGIMTELRTLLRIRMKQVRAQCPHCGAEHEWPVRDARVARAA
jgi:predicted RNA-binding Zn-ribbon protein involved in translation (DUF1610 family)